LYVSGHGLYVAGSREAEVGGVAAERPGAGVGVTDPEERVGLALHKVVGGETGRSWAAG